MAKGITLVGCVCVADNHCAILYGKDLRSYAGVWVVGWVADNFKSELRGFWDELDNEQCDSCR